jgi:uncharacterized protein YggE
MKRSMIAAALVVMVAVAADGASAAVSRTITVTGTGTITTVPNQAEFSFGVSTNAHTAEQALAANASRMNSVIGALKRLGLRPADLQTAEISLTPNTNQAGTSIIGYSASNTVTATTEAITKAGAIVDAAVGAGANLVSGPSLTPSDQLLLSRRALVAAIADARARATAIATAAGVALGPVQTVSEVSSTTPPPLPLGAEARAASPSTPVEAGTVQTQEDVTVTFAIS